MSLAQDQATGRCAYRVAPLFLVGCHQETDMPEHHDDDNATENTTNGTGSTPGFTRRSLRDKRRSDLDELADGWGLDPASFSNKQDLIDALVVAAGVEADRDVDENPHEVLRMPAPAVAHPPINDKAPDVPSAPKSHKGRWLVVEPIRYRTVEGVERRAEPWPIDEHGIVRDEHGRPAPNVIDDIPQDVAWKVHQHSGALQPFME